LNKWSVLINNYKQPYAMLKLADQAIRDCGLQMSFLPEMNCGMTKDIPNKIAAISNLTGIDSVPANADKTILFADDDGQLQTFVAALLKKAGYNTLVAHDGLDAMKKARAYNGDIHLLLSDVEMPGMTGIELAIQLNQERPHTKILLISGLDSGMLVLNNGWQFLPKPFMADMLRDRIRDFLSEQPSIKEHLASVLAEVREHPELQEHSQEVEHLAASLCEGDLQILAAGVKKV
jgi:DNA-binding NtrC family response regulator